MFDFTFFLHGNIYISFCVSGVAVFTYNSLIEYHAVIFKGLFTREATRSGSGSVFDVLFIPKKSSKFDYKSHIKNI